MSQNVSHTTDVADQNQVPWKERFSYSLSDFACNLSFQIVGTYLMIFYTDTFGISAVAVGTLFLVVRIVDAFDGPFWGIMIDHTHAKWGKSRSDCYGSRFCSRCPVLRRLTSNLYIIILQRSD